MRTDPAPAPSGWRCIALDPEHRSPDRELGDGEAPVVGGETVYLNRADGGLVVIDSLLSITDRQPGSNVRARCRSHGST